MSVMQWPSEPSVILGNIFSPDSVNQIIFGNEGRGVFHEVLKNLEPLPAQLTFSSPRSKQPRVRSSVNSSKEYVWLGGLFTETATG